MIRRFSKLTCAVLVCFTLSSTAGVSAAYAAVCGSSTHLTGRANNCQGKTVQGSNIDSLLPLALMAILMLFGKHNDSINETSGGVTIEEVDVPAELDWDELCAEYSGSGSGSNSNSSNSSSASSSKSSSSASSSTASSSSTSSSGSGSSSSSNDIKNVQNDIPKEVDICTDDPSLCKDLGDYSNSRSVVTSALNTTSTSTRGSTTSASSFDAKLDSYIRQSAAAGELLGKQVQYSARTMKATREKTVQQAKSIRTLAVGKQTEAAVGGYELQQLALNNEVVGNDLLQRGLTQAKAYRRRISNANALGQNMGQGTTTATK